MRDAARPRGARDQSVENPYATRSIGPRLADVTSDDPSAAGQDGCVNAMSTGLVPDWYRPPTPYEPGNYAAVKHGGTSPRLIEQRAQLERSGILELHPWLTDFPIVTANALRVEARALMHQEHIEHLVAEKGYSAVPEDVWRRADRADRLAAALWSRLGLDPVGRAQLKIALAGGAHAEQSLVDLLEQGRQVIARREAAQMAQESAGELGIVDGTESPGGGE